MCFLTVSCRIWSLQRGLSMTPPTSSKLAASWRHWDATLEVSGTLSALGPGADTHLKRGPE
eukprot:9671774-Lingulodinium_polyedra.AAC.1